MLSKANGNEVIDRFEKNKRLESAAKYYGLFLESLGFDYEADPQTIDTPNRVAKAWLNAMHQAVNGVEMDAALKAELWIYLEMAANSLVNQPD